MKSQIFAEYEEVDKLLLQDDPPETPYASRYKARDILEEILSQLDESSTQIEQSHQIRAHVLAKLGAVDHEVQELSACQKHLEQALKSVELEREGISGTIIIPHLIALNQLGILWTTRGELEQAQGHLEKARQLYLQFQTNGEGHGALLVDLLAVNSDPEIDVGERSKSVELLNVHTYYYLAQVYEKLGNKDKAGECCHITLKKQLEIKEYEPLDWAQNAATLSHFYEVNDNFAAAKTHLAAACFVLDRFRSEMESKEFLEQDQREEVMERVNQTQGLVLRCWGKYALVLLQKSIDRQVSQEDETIRIEDIEDDLGSSMLEEFPSIEIDAVYEDIPARFASTFEQARDIFLPGQRFLNQAKEHYTFEEHCTEFTEINQDISALHKALVYFESDPSRRFKIHKRRVELLEIPLNELSNSMYLLVRRQLMFELAETYEAMMDTKLDRVRSSTATALSDQMHKINSLVSKSVSFFTQFLDSLTNSEGQLPDPFHAETCRPALVAYFHLARLYDKFMVSESSPEAISNKTRVLQYFKEIADYCSRHPEAESVMREELPLCQEMVKLLPFKIQRMKLDLREQSSNVV